MGTPTRIMTEEQLFRMVTESQSYKKHFDEIIMPKDIKYPIDILSDIPKIEKLNDLKISVFEYDHEAVIDEDDQFKNIQNKDILYEYDVACRHTDDGSFENRFGMPSTRHPLGDVFIVVN